MLLELACAGDRLELGLAWGRQPPSPMARAVSVAWKAPWFELLYPVVSGFLPRKLRLPLVVFRAWRMRRSRAAEAEREERSDCGIPISTAKRGATM